MKQNNNLAKFILAVGFQLLVIFLIIASKLVILGSGQEIVLNVTPIDPRSPLRGDYLTFNYDISTVTTYQGNLRNGQVVYVTLRNSGGVWYQADVLTTKPKGNSVFLKGMVVSGGNDVSGTGYSTNFQIKYGIEDYFVPEGKGRGFNPSSQIVTVRVAVDENGNGVLKQVYVGNKPWP